MSLGEIRSGFFTGNCPLKPLKVTSAHQGDGMGDQGKFVRPRSRKSIVERMKEMRKKGTQGKSGWRKTVEKD